MRTWEDCLGLSSTSCVEFHPGAHVDCMGRALVPSRQLRHHKSPSIAYLAITTPSRHCQRLRAPARSRNEKPGVYVTCHKLL